MRNGTATINLTRYSSTDENGVIRYFLNGRIHREDGPASIFPDGYVEWRIGRRLHREDGPARISPDGYQEWWIDGRYRRAEGPDDGSIPILGAVRNR